MHNAIAYYRVSTERQGESGLGLEAQQLLIEDFAEQEGYVLIDAFTEVESGKKNARPLLAKAIKRCKRNKATLLIAYVDRLTRSLKLLIRLFEAKVPFKVANNPNAPKVVLEILAAIAEEHGDNISEKTKVALQAAKLHGTELGHNGHVLARLNRIKAKIFARNMIPAIAAIKEKGITSQRGIAQELNHLEIPTYRNDGSKWHRTTVRMLLIRIEHERQRQQKLEQNEKPII